mmetsp:Transcript_8604/g.17836  ORF Transcript_8604/g.17836 Transcript_8604/m.17836 type:complete len:240 (-) Transcript_8604:1-720(-)
MFLHFSCKSAAMKPISCSGLPARLSMSIWYALIDRLDKFSSTAGAGFDASPGHVLPGQSHRPETGATPASILPYFIARLHVPVAPRDVPVTYKRAGSAFSGPRRRRTSVKRDQTASSDHRLCHPLRMYVTRPLLVVGLGTTVMNLCLICSFLSRMSSPIPPVILSRSFTCPLPRRNKRTGLFSDVSSSGMTTKAFASSSYAESAWKIISWPNFCTWSSQLNINACIIASIATTELGKTM